MTIDGKNFIPIKEFCSKYGKSIENIRALKTLDKNKGRTDRFIKLDDVWYIWEDYERDGDKEREQLEVLYWKCIERIGNANILSSYVAPIVNKSRMAVYMYFNAFRFNRKQTTLLYLNALNKIYTASEDELSSLDRVR